MFAYGWIEEGLVLLCVSFCCYTTIIYHWRKFVVVLELIFSQKSIFFFYQTVIELRFLIEFEQYQYGWEGDKTCS